MYFFEALKNYRRVKTAYEAAKDAAMEYSRLKKEVDASPTKAVVVGGGKYILVDSMTFHEMLAADEAYQVSPKMAADLLLAMLESYHHFHVVSPRERRAISLAIEALGMTSPIEEAFNAAKLEVPKSMWFEGQLERIDKMNSSSEDADKSED